MSDVLSQNEIDSLLKALDDGEVDANEMKDGGSEKSVKLYDFKSPKKLAKDQLRTLQIIHENYARILSTFLSGYLRSYVKADVLNVEELSYYEFNNSIVNPAVLTIVNFRPLSGQIITDISPSLAYTLIDRILGGKGKAFEESRTFTEIETTLIKKLMNKLLGILIGPWENVIELDPKLDKIETNSQFAQIVSPNDTVALITLNLKIGDVEGMFNLCIPHIVIEPIIDKLSTKFWFSSASKVVTEKDKENLHKKVKRTDIEVSAELGHTYITVGDFLDLEVDDVIKLDNKAEDKIQVYIGNSKKYLGIPGTLNKNMSVKLTDICKKGDDLEDDE